MSIDSGSLADASPATDGPVAPGTADSQGGHPRRILKQITGAREAGLATVLIVLVVFLAWRSPFFFTVGNLTVVSRQIALSLFLSVGMTFVILSGAIDLSVGSVVALASITVASTMVDAGQPPYVGVLAGLAVGVVIGAANGVLVVRTKVPSFIITLGMLAIARGLALGFTQGATISGLPDSFLTLGQGLTLGVPNPVWIVAVVALTAHVVLTRTTFGRHVYFIGSNEQAARLSGIRVDRVKIAIFVICSTLAALSAVIETARLSVGQPSAGSGYELAAIGGVIIGGASLFGGEGSILGTILGTALLGIILNGLILLSISAYWQQVFSGAIIILAVSLNMWRQQSR